MRPLVTPGTPSTLLDIATGSGSVPLRIRELARRDGIDLRTTLTDVRDDMLRIAGSRATESGSAARISRLDAVREEIREEFDFVTSNLFMHHLAKEEVQVVLKKMMHATRIALIVNDLTRSAFSRFAVNLASRVVTRSSVVHTDGDLSVRAAFTPEEFQGIAAQAGLVNAEILPAGPCRFMLVWKKHAN